jgi:integrase
MAAPDDHDELSQPATEVAPEWRAVTKSAYADSGDPAYADSHTGIIRQTPSAPRSSLVQPPSSLPAPLVFDGLTAAGERQGSDDDEERYQTGPSMDQSAPWRRELHRWLATLNPGRTQREYEKAVCYFFQTPGVPQSLDELSFDLLLAYRGALALRATAHDELTPRARRGSGPMLGAAERARLASASDDGVDGDQPGNATNDRGRDSRSGALAPATVNLRLTALRQFLVYCALYGSLRRLIPDRIRAALKRLSIERRRPYQVLAEPEWDEFLAAARLPLETLRADGHGAGAASDGEVAPQPALPATRSPWGVPRALRLQRRAEQSPVEADDLAPEPPPQSPSPLPRSRAGLTGARTAQRDHALIALALATGLRAIELASLDVGDLSREWHAGQEEWWLILPDKKTKGQRGGRILPLDGALMETLRAYLAAAGRRWERAADRATPLFIVGPARPSSENEQPKRSGEGEEPSRRKRWTPRRLSPNQIRRIVDRVETQWLALRAGEAGAALDEDGALGETRLISPHALRHSTAVALLEGNDTAGRPPASVEHVRGWLGHFDIRTTQGYLAHIEGRKHRRPFTLAPGAGAKNGKRGGHTSEASPTE